MNQTTAAGCAMVIAAFAMHTPKAWAQEQTRELVLRLRSGVIPGLLLANAKLETTRILRQANVQVSWKNSGKLDNQRRRLCAGPDPDIDEIDIQVIAVGNRG